jgi:hypothetical protein
VCAARRGAARGRGDLRVGGARDAGAAARRGRRGWGLAGTQAAAQSRVARSPCLRHGANPRCEANHLHSISCYFCFGDLACLFGINLIVRECCRRAGSDVAKVNGEGHGIGKASL